jgi:glyoxylase-like metal-dependent hydrolase (beta-lactamase superfamily II)
MKTEQLSEHVWKVSAKVFILTINVWIVTGEQGITLIDAGIGSMGKGILKAIEELKQGPLRRIVLTHGHSDHIGSLKQLLARYPDAVVYAHEQEIPYMEGRLPYPKRKKAQAFFRPGLVQSLPYGENGDLAEIAGLKPYFTPGHAPGHVGYYHERDRVFLAGDLFTSKQGKLKPPMAIFTADMKQAVESGQVVERINPKLVSICHGGEVSNPGEQYAAYRAAAFHKYKLG